MRARWRERVGNRPVSYLLVADDPERSGWLRVLGPASVEGPVRSVDAAALARTIGDLAAMSALESVRHLAEEITRLGGEGLHVEGLLSRHTAEVRFKENSAMWAEATTVTAGLSPSDGWRAVLTKLGYKLEQRPTRGYLARYDGRPVAVVHPKNSPRAFTRLDEQGRPSEGLLARDCRDAGAPYGLLAHDGRFRLFHAGSTQEWLDIDTRLLGTERKPFLALLSPSYLSGDGLAELRAEARRFGTALRKRLDRTIRFEAFPALAAGLDEWIAASDEDIGDDARREELERAALTLMFRILFILYAESSGFLPMNNATYRKKSLTELVAEAAETAGKWSEASTALWSQFVVLVRAMRHGNRAWDVPAYNGSLFASTDFEGAELLERMELTDPHFARLLIAVGWDSSQRRGIDYSSLEIGHLGHIYEALLSLRLSVTDRPLRYDPGRDRYVPDEDRPEVGGGTILGPGSVVAAEDVPMRILGSKRPPLAAGGCYVEDRVDDVALRQLGWPSHPPSTRIGRNHIRDRFPLVVGQIFRYRSPFLRGAPGLPPRSVSPPEGTMDPTEKGWPFATRPQNPNMFLGISCAS